MTPIPPEADKDLELLDLYLDNALAPEETDALVRRLADDPELARQLGVLQVERSLRQKVWQNMEGTDAEVATVLRNVRQSLNRRRWWEDRLLDLRIVGAVAACLVLGFIGGRFGQPSETGQATSSVFDTTSARPVEPQKQQAYHVRLTDGRGNVVAVQQFEKLEDAQEFVNDLSLWQQQQQQRPAPALAPQPKGERF